MEYVMSLPQRTETKVVWSPYFSVFVFQEVRQKVALREKVDSVVPDIWE